MVDYLDTVIEKKDMVDKYIDDYDNSIFIIGNAYAYKLYEGIPINEFDLFNNGNMGYDGDNKFIKKIGDKCLKESCVFFVEKMNFEKYVQFSEKIYNYVLDNYNCIDRKDKFFVYDNLE